MVRWNASRSLRLTGTTLELAQGGRGCLQGSLNGTFEDFADFLEGQETSDGARLAI